MMKVLAIETSTRKASLAIGDHSHVDARISLSDKDRIGHVLLPSLDSLFEEAKMDLDEIDLIVVGHGPGSFTGVRVGMSVAKALAFQRKIPLLALDSFYSMAEFQSGLNQEEHFFLNAGRGEVYHAAYRLASLPSVIIQPQKLDYDEAKAFIRQRESSFWGDESLKDILGISSRKLKADNFLNFAENLYQRDGSSNLHRCEPLYIRASDAKLPEKKLRHF